ncbi:metabolite traffic protein EboE [Limibacter armeniacum]|uniref:metabolite traffic protein EboE n=1 Tax=Limibacter armeniacum TaxID=466084 RepID=UPI002FE58639
MDLQEPLIFLKMIITDKYHLSYCTNNISGENWSEIKAKLQSVLPQVKKEVCPNEWMGTGLRIGYQAACDLNIEELSKFKEWLDENKLYVHTLNGFPFGTFHQERVKDNVHRPDWMTDQRYDYTLKLSKILAKLLPHFEEDGSISTSPLSYAPWHGSNTAAINQVYKVCANRLSRLVGELYDLKIETAKNIHIDIEPEPDGMLESTEDVISFFNTWLLPIGIRYLIQHKGISVKEAENAIRTHIQVCFDVCHLALVYEDPVSSFKSYAENQIGIGKIQISSAVEANFTGQKERDQKLLSSLSALKDYVYLHQVANQLSDGTILRYKDLCDAFVAQVNEYPQKWRVHYHIPVFLDALESLSSTQHAVISTLEHFFRYTTCKHLEVETYTWEVMPKNLRPSTLEECVTKEISWVKDQLERVFLLKTDK